MVSRREITFTLTDIFFSKTANSPRQPLDVSFVVLMCFCLLAVSHTALEVVALYQTTLMLVKLFAGH